MSLGKKESPYLTSRDIFSDKHIEIDIMMAISAKTIINKNAKALKIHSVILLSPVRLGAP